MFSEGRILIDVIYCFEFVQMAIMVRILALYFTELHARTKNATAWVRFYIWNAFLAGLQIGGAIAYYVPDIILGESTSVITNLDRCIALMWVVVGCWIVRWGLHGVVQVVETSNVETNAKTSTSS